MPKRQNKSMNSSEESEDPSSTPEEKQGPTIVQAPVPSPAPTSAVSAPQPEEHEDESGPEEEMPPRRDVPPNHIFIGKKPVMGYALSAVMQLTQYPEVVLRARGKAISRAVDVAQVVIKRLGNGQIDVKSIKIDTEVLGEGEERRNVSTIEVSLGKKA
jgi:DNA-binding protein